jgi:hypothetical protein
MRAKACNDSGLYLSRGHGGADRIVIGAAHQASHLLVSASAIKNLCSCWTQWTEQNMLVQALEGDTAATPPQTAGPEVCGAGYRAGSGGQFHRDVLVSVLSNEYMLLFNEYHIWFVVGHHTQAHTHTRTCTHTRTRAHAQKHTEGVGGGRQREAESRPPPGIPLALTPPRPRPSPPGSETEPDRKS